MNFLLALLFQLIAYLALLAVSDYVGTLLALIIGVIALGVWAISHLTEWIQPSRVSRHYYAYVLSAWLAPFAAVLTYVVLRGEFAWL